MDTLLSPPFICNVFIETFYSTFHSNSQVKLQLGFGPSIFSLCNLTTSLWFSPASLPYWLIFWHMEMACSAPLGFLSWTPLPFRNFLPWKSVTQAPKNRQSPRQSPRLTPLLPQEPGNYWWFSDRCAQGSFEPSHHHFCNSWYGKSLWSPGSTTFGTTSPLIQAKVKSPARKKAGKFNRKLELRWEFGEV